MRNVTLILILAVVGMAGCQGLEISLDDEARDAVDCLASRDNCDHDDSTTINDEDGSNSAGNAEDSGRSSDDDILDGFVILDSSRKGDRRYLMGTYVNADYFNYSIGYNYQARITWHLPVAARAFAHENDSLIDFEDADGNLLWIATETEDGFDFESEVTVNGIERDFTCSCQITRDNWDCGCTLQDSSAEYSLDYTRIGLDQEDVHDSDVYTGIRDERNYDLVLSTNSACEYANYILPENVAVKYRGRNIDFEDDDGELWWSADLHEDETFDFTAGGFPDDYGRPDVDLGCTCEVWTQGSSGGVYEITRDNSLYCYCASTAGVDCDVTYH